MKSPYKLSQELSVTPQAVYKKIKQLNNELNVHIKKEKGKILLDEEAERILRNSFSEVQQSVQQPVDEQLINQSGEFNNQFNSEIEFLREQNKNLQEQNKSLQEELNTERNHSRDVTNKLIELTSNSQELTRNSQLLLNQEQQKNTLLLSDERLEENKKSLWQRLFKKKNKS